MTRVRTLAEGRPASQGGAQRADDRAETGRFGGQGLRPPELGSLGRAAEEQGPVWAGQRRPEQSGDFLGARLGLGPGCPALRDGCPWGAWAGGARRGAVLTVGWEQSACCHAHLGLRLDSGGLGQGAGPAGTAAAADVTGS